MILCTSLLVHVWVHRLSTAPFILRFFFCDNQNPMVRRRPREFQKFCFIISNCELDWTGTSRVLKFCKHFDIEDIGLIASYRQYQLYYKVTSNCLFQLLVGYYKYQVLNSYIKKLLLIVLVFSHIICCCWLRQTVAAPGYDTESIIFAL